jgi:hypothetical protein
MPAPTQPPKLRWWEKKIHPKIPPELAKRLVAPPKVTQEKLRGVAGPQPRATVMSEEKPVIGIMSRKGKQLTTVSGRQLTSLIRSMLKTGKYTIESKAIVILDKAVEVHEIKTATIEELRDKVMCLETELLIAKGGATVDRAWMDEQLELKARAAQAADEVLKEKKWNHEEQEFLPF